jgi:arsenate reductase
LVEGDEVTKVELGERARRALVARNHHTRAVAGPIGDPRLRAAVGERDGNERPSQIVDPNLLPSMVADAGHLVTMGCGEACPIAPPSVVRDDWPLEDPKGKPIERVREIRDEVRERVARFVRENGWERS